MASFEPYLWFKQLFGFEESVSSVRENIKIIKEKDNYKMLSTKNNKEYNAGNFQIRYISSFLNESSELPHRGGGSFNILCGKGRKTKNFSKIDAFSMQSLPENDGATYLAASNFNCLELVSHFETPDNGVTEYIYDNTQGPYTALACPQSAVYRNYFCEHPGKKIIGQLEKQINLLSKTPLKVDNGYVIISQKDIYGLVNEKFNWSDENNYAVGVHNYCDVLMTRGDNGQFKFVETTDRPIIANHVYAASFNFYDDVLKDKFTIEIAQNILKAEYKATILAAWENSIKMEKEGRAGAKKLYLTLLGGGVFDNPIEIITNAILSCKKEIIDSGLEVYVVSFDKSSSACIDNLKSLVEETKGAIIDVD